MWIFLPDAFLSIVDKGDETGCTLLVRARRSGDIERIFPEAQVIEGAGTDYRYRARILRSQVVDAIAESVRSIAYGNFKNQVTDDDRHNAYFEVWRDMNRFQENPRRK
ncbi:conserved hypothetical protein [Candidatus Accumulibacter aalborgensis]|uniref:Uncharacterized protein n=1 Tax=Candidatus Accumulibacter aalborgensis TaxID=1860102 RepID=A0A1A8XUZ5_9PROT|nr:hypothetical protein [Candidatus Accumulibacter aalborgensis]SBT08402.1 conserved hypothetical protein [Candidatus Accumulibacter aalborgensis]